MKVLMIAPTPFFSDRGCHTQIYEEIKALQKLGHEIVLCTYGLGRDMPGVKTVRTVNMPWYHKLSAGPSYTKIILLPFLTFTTIKTILQFNPEIIHGHLHEGALIARFCSNFFSKKKYLFDMQGSLSGEILQHGFMKKGSLFHRFILFFERKIANWFFVITQSDSMIKELESFGVNPERMRNVKDGVDTDIFCPQPFNKELADKIQIDQAMPRVLYMGLLEQYQGADLMFDAFEIVAKSNPSVQFIVIGYPNVEKYQKVCESKGILNQVKFLGRIDYSILPGYLSLADIAIAPKIALTEGDGKIYNYMAMGMVTIAFDRSVSREILGDTALFAKFGDANAMAEKIIWALNHPVECKDLGKESRERAIQNLSWNAVGRRINEVYLTL
jgi:glycosyltransferase involved in cell wall biosynthesis